MLSVNSIEGAATKIKEYATKINNNKSNDELPIDALFVDDTGALLDWVIKSQNESERDLVSSVDAISVISDIANICKHLGLSDGKKKFDIPSSITNANINDAINKIISYLHLILNNGIKGDMKTITKLFRHIAELLAKQTPYKIDSSLPIEELGGNVIFAITMMASGALQAYHRHMVVIYTLSKKISFVSDYLRKYTNLQKDAGNIDYASSKMIDLVLGYIDTMSSVSSKIIDTHSAEFSMLLNNPATWDIYQNTLHMIDNKQTIDAELGLKICIAITLAGQLADTARKIDKELGDNLNELITKAHIMDDHSIYILNSVFESIRETLSSQDQDKWTSYTSLIIKLIAPDFRISGGNFNPDLVIDAAEQQMKYVLESDTIGGGDMKNMNEDYLLLGSAVKKLKHIDTLLNSEVVNNINSKKLMLFDSNYKISYSIVYQLYSDFVVSITKFKNYIMENSKKITSEIISLMNELSQVLEGMLDKSIISYIAKINALQTASSDEILIIMIFVFQLDQVRNICKKIYSNGDYKTKVNITDPGTNVNTAINNIFSYVTQAISKRNKTDNDKNKSDDINLYKYVKSESSSRFPYIDNPKKLKKFVLGGGGALTETNEYVIIPGYVLKCQPRVCINGSGLLDIPKKDVNENTFHLLMNAIPEITNVSVPGPYPSKKASKDKKKALKKNASKAKKRIKGGLPPEIIRGIEGTVDSVIDDVSTNLRAVAPDMIRTGLQVLGMQQDSVAVSNEKKGSDTKKYLDKIFNSLQRMRAEKNNTKKKSDDDLSNTNIHDDTDDESDIEIEYGDIDGGGTTMIYTPANQGLYDEYLTGGVVAMGINDVNSIGTQISREMNTISTQYMLSLADESTVELGKESIKHTTIALQGMKDRLNTFMEKTGDMVPDQYQSTFIKWRDMIMSSLDGYLMCEHIVHELRKVFVELLTQKDTIININLPDEDDVIKIIANSITKITSLLEKRNMCNEKNITPDKYMNSYKIIKNTLTSPVQIIGPTSENVLSSMNPLTPESTSSLLENPSTDPLSATFTIVLDTLDYINKNYMNVTVIMKLVSDCMNHINRLLTATQVTFIKSAPYIIVSNKPFEILPISNKSDGIDKYVDLYKETVTPAGNFTIMSSKENKHGIAVGRYPLLPVVDATATGPPPAAAQTYAIETTMPKDEFNNDVHLPFVVGTWMHAKMLETDPTNEIDILNHMAIMGATSILSMLVSATMLKKQTTREIIESGPAIASITVPSLIMGGSDNKKSDNKDITMNDILHKNEDGKYMIKPEIFEEVFSPNSKYTEYIMADSQDNWPTVLCLIRNFLGSARMKSILIRNSNRGQIKKIEGGVGYGATTIVQTKITEVKNYIETMCRLSGMNKIGSNILPQLIPQVCELMIAIYTVKEIIDITNKSLAKYEGNNMNVVISIDNNTSMKSILDLLEYSNFESRYRTELNAISPNRMMSDTEFFISSFLIIQQYIKNNIDRPMSSIIQEFFSVSIKSIRFSSLKNAEQRALLQINPVLANHPSDDVDNSIEKTISMYSQQGLSGLSSMKYTIGQTGNISGKLDETTLQGIFMSSNRALSMCKNELLLIADIQEQLIDLINIDEPVKMNLAQLQNDMIEAAKRALNKSTNARSCIKGDTINQIEQIWKKHTSPVSNLSDPPEFLWPLIITDMIKAVTNQLDFCIKTIMICSYPIFIGILTEMLEVTKFANIQPGMLATVINSAISAAAVEMPIYGLIEYRDLDNISGPIVMPTEGHTPGAISIMQFDSAPHNFSYVHAITHAHDYIVKNYKKDQLDKETIIAVALSYYPAHYLILHMRRVLIMLNSYYGMLADNNDEINTDFYNLSNMTSCLNIITVLGETIINMSKNFIDKPTKDMLMDTIKESKNLTKNLTNPLSGAPSMIRNLQTLAQSSTEIWSQDIDLPAPNPGYISTKIDLTDMILYNIIPFFNATHEPQGVSLCARDPVHRLMLTAAVKQSNLGGAGVPMAYIGGISHMGFHDIYHDSCYIADQKYTDNTLATLNKIIGLLLMCSCQYDVNTRKVVIYTPLLETIQKIIFNNSGNGFYPDMLDTLIPIENIRQNFLDDQGIMIDINCLTDTDPVTEMVVQTDKNNRYTDHVQIAKGDMATNQKKICGVPEEHAIITESLALYTNNLIAIMNSQVGIGSGTISGITYYTSTENMPEHLARSIRSKCSIMMIHIEDLMKRLNSYLEIVNISATDIFSNSIYKDGSRIQRMGNGIHGVTDNNRLSTMMKNATPHAVHVYMENIIKAQIVIGCDTRATIKNMMQEFDVMDFMYTLPRKHSSSLSDKQKENVTLSSYSIIQRSIGTNGHVSAFMSPRNNTKAISPGSKVLLREVKSATVGRVQDHTIIMSNIRSATTVAIERVKDLHSKMTSEHVNFTGFHLECIEEYIARFTNKPLFALNAQGDGYVQTQVVYNINADVQFTNVRSSVNLPAIISDSITNYQASLTVIYTWANMMIEKYKASQQQPNLNGVLIGPGHYVLVDIDEQTIPRLYNLTKSITKIFGICATMLNTINEYNNDISTPNTIMQRQSVNLPDDMHIVKTDTQTKTVPFKVAPMANSHVINMYTDYECICQNSTMGMISANYLFPTVLACTGGIKRRQEIMQQLCKCLGLSKSTIITPDLCLMLFEQLTNIHMAISSSKFLAMLNKYTIEDQIMRTLTAGNTNPSVIRNWSDLTMISNGERPIVDRGMVHNLNENKYKRLIKALIEKYQISIPLNAMRIFSGYVMMSGSLCAASQFSHVLKYMVPSDMVDLEENSPRSILINYCFGREFLNHNSLMKIYSAIITYKGKGYNIIAEICNSMGMYIPYDNSISMSDELSDVMDCRITEYVGNTTSLGFLSHEDFETMANVSVDVYNMAMIHNTKVCSVLETPSVRNSVLMHALYDMANRAMLAY